MGRWPDFCVNWLAPKRKSHPLGMLFFEGNPFAVWFSGRIKRTPILGVPSRLAAIPLLGMALNQYFREGVLFKPLHPPTHPLPALFACLFVGFHDLLLDPLVCQLISLLIDLRTRSLQHQRLHFCIYVFLYIHIYIYIQTEREGEKERERESDRKVRTCNCRHTQKIKPARIGREYGGQCGSDHV